MRGFNMSDFISVDAAVQQLGITMYEANNLDALDSKKDGKIKASIFSEAKAALDNAKPSGNESQSEEVNNFSNLGAAAKCIASSIAKKMGLGGYFFSDKQDYQATHKDENGNEVLDPNLEKMCELTSTATDYIDENGSTNLKGFTYEDGIPDNVENININTELVYNDGSNDTVTFDENGNGAVEKNPDEAITRTKYSINGSNYEIGYIWGNDE